jgi:hypothetical protein
MICCTEPGLTGALYIHTYITYIHKRKFEHAPHCREVCFPTLDFGTNNNLVIIPRSPYPPGLAPCDFTLFFKLKMKLKGRRFETVSDIQKKSPAVLDSIKENDLHGAFEAWKKQWDRCTRSQGH